MRKESLGSKQAAMPPRVRIFFVIGDKLFVDSTLLSEAGHYGDHLIHERGHDDYWAQLVRTAAVPDVECSRGEALPSTLGQFAIHPLSKQRTLIHACPFTD